MDAIGRMRSFHLVAKVESRIQVRQELAMWFPGKLFASSTSILN